MKNTPRDASSHFSPKHSSELHSPSAPVWFRLDAAANYCDVSTRTFRAWIKEGLPTARVGGILLVNRAWIDDFLSRHVVHGNQVDKLVDDLLKDFCA